MPVGSVTVDPTGAISVQAADDTPRTYHERQKRLMGQDDAEIGAAVPQLPPSSPWSSDPVGPEKLINRTEDQSHG